LFVYVLIILIYETFCLKDKKALHNMQQRS